MTGGGHSGAQGLASSQGSLETRVMINPDGSEEVVDEGGEVFKAPGDMECSFLSPFSSLSLYPY